MEPQEDTSSRKKGKAPFLLVALGAVFLLVGVGLLGILSGRPEQTFLANTAVPFENSFNQIAAHGTPIVPETPELVLLGGIGVKAAIPPVTVTPQVLGAIVGGLETGFKPEISRYVIEIENTPSLVAEKFQISLNTILWANDLKSTSTLAVGKELVILPISGTLHLVRPHDTLSEIALWYKGDTKEIAEYNGLESAADIYAGDLIIIPGGVMPRTLPAGRLTPLANSYFIYPIPAPHRITQALHPFNAIDFSNGFCGEPVYAAAGGTIQRTGYQNMGGNYVRILHPNGVVTYYGHLSRYTVSSGGRIFQGEIIGYTGYSGYTIPAGPAGCHVHFGVRGASNPFR
ncbi:peptidoglycan DD-metalloendopeptidase family protein [Patescibacteria group bacterium]|nr:peptidoglycan DD-metalloendopeptidase family protein [Patescibacteria group bacterium]